MRLVGKQRSSSGGLQNPLSESPITEEPVKLEAGWAVAAVMVTAALIARPNSSWGHAPGFEKTTEPELEA